MVETAKKMLSMDISKVIKIPRTLFQRSTCLPACLLTRTLRIKTKKNAKNHTDTLSIGAPWKRLTRRNTFAHPARTPGRRALSSHQYFPKKDERPTELRWQIFTNLHPTCRGRAPNFREKRAAQTLPTKPELAYKQDVLFGAILAGNKNEPSRCLAGGAFIGDN